MGASTSVSSKRKPQTAEEQVKQLTKQLESSKSRVSSLEALLLASSISLPPSDSSFAECSAAIISGKNRRNEQFLRDIFTRHKDATGGLSGQNLIQALLDADAPNIPTSDQDVVDIIKQFDANSNKTLEFCEFQQVVNEPDELQLWLSEKQLPLAADALRALIGRGSEQLKKMSQLSPADIDHAAAATCSIMPGMLKELHQELQGAFAIQTQIEADMKTDPSKFNNFQKMACGNVSNFHQGLTGRVGMPHLNFKHAMRQEHCERAGCDVAFMTGNYKITTTPRQEWQCIVENIPCPDMGHQRRIIPISELLQLDVSKNAKLCEEEVIAIVLYTGPMFQIYNTILRRYPEDKFAVFRDGDNLYSTTIFVLVSAVQKLSRFTRISQGTLLYRGLGGKIDLPDIFFQIDDQGCSGYAEWGFLSTTSDRDVALGYSGVKERRPKAMVMVIETSSIDRGADISDFSQYPGEKEFLYLPCSFVQRIRHANMRIQVVDGGLVTFFPVKVNLNIKTQTVEELQEQKKSLHMVSARSMLAEVKFELTDWMESADRQEDVVIKFCDDVLGTCRQVVENHELIDVKDFADDEKFRRMINEVLDTKADAIGAKKWQQTRMQLRSHDFEAATCVATLSGHSYSVVSVAFHPTAPILATGSGDNTAKLWHISLDSSSVTCVATLSGHSCAVQSVAFHPTALIFATGSDDETAKLWHLSPDNASAKCVATLTGHDDSVRSVAFHPTSPILATGSADKTAKLWRLSPASAGTDNASAKCEVTLTGHDDLILSIAFHPTAPIMATGSADKTAKLWLMYPHTSLSYTRCVATLSEHSGTVWSVAFHSTAPILATGSADKTVKLWRLSLDYESAKCVATLSEHSGTIWSVAFHPTSPILATGSADKTAKLWRLSLDSAGTDNESAKCVATLSEHSGTIWSVAFHPTAPILATGSDDKTAKLWR